MKTSREVAPCSRQERSSPRRILGVGKPGIHASHDLSAAACRRAVDRQRAGRWGDAAAAGEDPRLEPSQPAGARTRSAGCESVDLGLVADDEASITRALEQGAARCDAIVTSGGVSVGVADHMKTVLGRLGAGSLRWMEILIRPAKPFGFATLTDSEVPVLCLPGNPVAAMVSFELLARSAFRLMGGHAVLEHPALLALTDGPISRRRDGTLHLVRVIARVDTEGRLHVRPIGGEGSHLLRAMALANALALVPDGEEVAAEKPVRVILLDAEELEVEKVPT